MISEGCCGLYSFQKRDGLQRCRVGGVYVRSRRQWTGLTAAGRSGRRRKDLISHQYSHLFVLDSNAITDVLAQPEFVPQRGIDLCHRGAYTLREMCM